MSAWKKLVTLLSLALYCVSAFAVTDADVFAYAAANYPGLFAGTATAGQYQQYRYRYYPATQNFLAIDSSGGIFIEGAATGGRLAPVSTVDALANVIADWKAAPGSQNASAVVLGGSVQGKTLDLAGSVTTFAGSVDAGAQDGAGVAASFNNPVGVTSDGSNLYVADLSNNRIRKIVIATGEVSTLAGSGVKGTVDGIGVAAAFDGPSAITTDGVNLYVTDLGDARIRKIVIATAEVTTLAGSGVRSSRGLFAALGVSVGSCTNGIGTAAGLGLPSGITTDGVNLYVVDAGCSGIRKVVIATGEVSTMAGGEFPEPPQGLHVPYGITTDGINLYVTDFNTIRKIVIATGAMSTLAGGGVGVVPNEQNMHGCFADGVGTAAAFCYPQYLTTDGVYLYVVDWASGLIRKIEIATGAVTTLAGSIAATHAVDGVGSSAGFNGPAGITTDGVSLYVADRLSANGTNNSIRRIR